MEEKVYLAALNKCFIGDWKTARQLLQYARSAYNAFNLDRKTLENLLPGREAAVVHLTGTELVDRASREIEYCRREGIDVISIVDDSYPARLAETPDAPLVLFKKGSRKVNGSRILAVVGTRHSTQYSKKYCDMLAEHLSSLKNKPVIVSGLAYGVDSWAHQSALRYGLDTIAITATGLDTVYPSSNRHLAEQIAERGAIVTEFWSQTESFPSNFLFRNRIIAGMSDATVVVESRSRGGSLVTARAAFNYDREVFAFPGRMDDDSFAGCNTLIASDMAHLVSKVSDISTALGWDPGLNRGVLSIENTLSPEKKAILQALRKNGVMDAAQIAGYCSANISRISLLLLEMEIEGCIRHVSANKYVSLM